MASETDSIPRTTLIDLFTALRVVAKDSRTTLESLRQHFCVDRKRRIVGDLLWSTAAYNAQELSRLGLVEIGAIPKNKGSYERLKNRSLNVTDRGRGLISTFKSDRAEAYDRLFALMFAAHPYLRTFVSLLNSTPILVPVVTSWRDHISPRYSSAVALVEDVSRGKIDLDSFFHLLKKRLRRELKEPEQVEISQKMNSVLREASLAATSEDPTEFAKKFLLKINDCVLPAILKNEGLVFDYRTHRTLWALGQEWKLWQSTSDHPEYNGRLVYKTATISVLEEGDQIESLSFDSGLAKTRENFLDKLCQAYLELQQSTGDTYALAWQLRAVFCFANRCQESVFDRLMEEHYTGSDRYDLTLEIQGQHGQYERPLRVGRRDIGLIRVVKK